MAKKTLDSNIGFDDIASRLHFTQVALGLAGDDGDKEVAALLPPLGKLLLRWQDLDRDKTAQGLATIRGHALCKRRDMQLDAALTAVHNATLAAANQDRKLALFTHLFPRPLSELTKPALESQLKIATALLDRLGQSEAHAALKKAHDKPLREAISQGEAALKERVRLNGVAAELTRRVDVLWEDANAALQGVDGGLQTLAAKRRLSRQWVASFFPDGPARAKKSAQPAKPAEPSEALAHLGT